MSILTLVLSYLLGSIPTGLWLGLKLRGIDIREQGSKNIGATNTARVLGKKLGAIAFIGDVAKGVVPVLFIARMGSWPYLPLACGLAAIIGHTTSVFLKFRGGKGVATAAGVYLALAPIPTLIALAVFAAVFAATRMVSVGSICAVITLTVAINITGASIPLRAITVMVALLIIWKHRTNIGRIFKGEENRF